MAAIRRPDQALVDALEANRYHPLWTRFQRIAPIAPRRRDAPMHWAWRDFEPFGDRAAREVPIEDVERRAIICANPAFGDQTASTSNLLGAFTILEPGDHARAHRHTAAAIRFGVRSQRAVTWVNGQRCEMHKGDLVLTPPMCWHGHVNEGDTRTFWFDAANIPLVCTMEANFFEPPAAGATLQEPGAGAWPRGAKYRYPATETQAALDAAAPAADGSRTVRYTNPATGGAVMPTLDCYAMRLAAGAATRPRRVTHNAVVLVVSGEGTSTIGDERFAWRENDVFTVPQWTWATHCAQNGGAEFFLVTDRSVFEALELLRIEEAA